MSDDKPIPIDERVIEEESITPEQAKKDKEQQTAVKDYSQIQDTKRLSMNVKVYSPFRDYYDGPAFSISAVNTTGPFDILPRHHNFISLLAKCELVIRTVRKGDQRIRISGGIMHVKADRVIVFLDV